MMIYVMFSPLAITWWRESMRARLSSARRCSTRRKATPSTRTRWGSAPLYASLLPAMIKPSPHYLVCSPQMGEAHEKTKESSEYLKYLTQQAVALQRTMNEIYKNGSNASITPLKVTALS